MNQRGQQMAKGISIMQEEGKEKGLAALVPPKQSTAISSS